MGLLYRGLGSSSERKMCAPEKLGDLDTLRYAASELSDRFMLLDL